MVFESGMGGVSNTATAGATLGSAAAGCTVFAGGGVMKTPAISGWTVERGRVKNLAATTMVDMIERACLGAQLMRGC